MYLHLGQDTVVKTDEVIGIFDIENATVSGATKKYLANAQKKGNVISVTEEIPKSFVLCRKGKRVLENSKTKVYISQISSSTLRKRANYVQLISNIK